MLLLLLVVFVLVVCPGRRSGGPSPRPLRTAGGGRRWAVLLLLLVVMICAQHIQGEMTKAGVKTKAGVSSLALALLTLASTSTRAMRLGASGCCSLGLWRAGGCLCVLLWLSCRALASSRHLVVLRLLLVLVALFAASLVLLPLLLRLLGLLDLHGGLVRHELSLLLLLFALLLSTP